MSRYRHAYDWSRRRGRSKTWATLFGIVCALGRTRHGDGAQRP